MDRYETPAVLASYEAVRLAEEAAVCATGYDKQPNPSDRRLKERISEIEAPVERLSGIRTR